MRKLSSGCPKCTLPKKVSFCDLISTLASKKPIAVVTSTDAATFSTTSMTIIPAIMASTVVADFSEKKTKEYSVEDPNPNDQENISNISIRNYSLNSSNLQEWKSTMDLTICKNVRFSFLRVLVKFTISERKDE